MNQKISRRSLLMGAAGMGAVVAGSQWRESAHAYLQGSGSFPVQVGDVTSDSAIIWTRGDRGTNVEVEISPHKNFRRSIRRRIGRLREATDYTGQVDIKGLQPGRDFYYRIRSTSERDHRSKGRYDRGDRGSILAQGQFQTAPASSQDKTVRFVWVADMAGQGWGRNPDFEITAFDGEKIKGGYVVFDVIRKFQPDFAVFQGDMIYADNAIPATKEIPAEIGGGIWRNIPKDFVAITLDEFRANWKYNLADEKFQHFLAETPIYVEWDDHEVTNNWYPGEILPAGAPYNGLPVDVIAERSEQALFEYNPIRGRNLFRSFRHGKHLEVFLLDERSFRGPNPDNSDPNGIEMLGERQFRWLKKELKRSTATWKVIATHDPFTIVTGGPTDRDSWSQNEDAILGREVQLRKLLQFIKNEKIKNVVSITADVHFAAAIEASPERAAFKDFNPFWEFVIGPINAGAFGTNDLDPSFGPAYEFVRSPGTENLPLNLPPTKTDLQFFGLAEVDGRNASLTVQIRDITGQKWYEKVLRPE